MIDKYKTCKDCPDRVVGCHSTCKGYLDRVQRNKEIAEKRRQIKAVEDYELTVRLNSRWRAQRSHKKTNIYK